MMRGLGVALAVLAMPAAAQVVSPLRPSVDTTNLATKAEVAAAKAAADAACVPMAMVPPIETPGGTTGSGQNCRLINAADNRISRTGQFTVGAGGAILCGGSATCLWRDPAGNAAPLPAGASSYPVFFTPIGTSATVSVRCKVASSANTGFTGATCKQSAVSVALLGAAVEVDATSGTQVFILSVPSTQASQ